MAKSPKTLGISFQDLERAFDSIEKSRDFQYLRKILRKILENIDFGYTSINQNITNISYELAVDGNVVLKSLFDENTILYAEQDDTPLPLTVAASRILGRKATGPISSLTNSEARTVLGLAETDTPTFAGVNSTGTVKTQRLLAGGVQA
jgi:hypothetical protein